ncbi:MAG TPA: hypothetical protein VGR06_11795 [Actinophytocola sp.]|uniref:hypothetical protein n=1 Tax=Actinophytocola sp. TaxID=1872138 RepID=UPI002DFE68C0|nr:hypothetical protein [Actinophytocola sp.]
MTEARYGFVLSEWHRHAGWESFRKKVPVSGASAEELTARLRPWALDTLAQEHLSDGEYWASLVGVDGHGQPDETQVLDVVDIFWFHGEEFVPASSVS